MPYCLIFPNYILQIVSHLQERIIRSMMFWHLFFLLDFSIKRIFKNALILHYRTFFKIALCGHIFMINDPREFMYFSDTLFLLLRARIFVKSTFENETLGIFVIILQILRKEYGYFLKSILFIVRSRRIEIIISLFWHNFQQTREWNFVGKSRRLHSTAMFLSMKSRFYVTSYATFSVQF